MIHTATGVLRTLLVLALLFVLVAAAFLAGAFLVAALLVVAAFLAGADFAAVLVPVAFLAAGAFFAAGLLSPDFGAASLTGPEVPVSDGEVSKTILQK